MRFFVGREGLASGEGKRRDSAWMDCGRALQGYWTNTVAIPEDVRPAITYGWFHDFLRVPLDHQAYTRFAKVTAIGEALVGVRLIVGALAEISAFFGSLMHVNEGLAGSASSDPVLFALGMLLVLGRSPATSASTGCRCRHWARPGSLAPRFAAR